MPCPRFLTTLAIIAGLTLPSTLFAQCEIHEDAKLTASDAQLDGFRWFGWSVSVSGDTAVVGALYDDCAGGQNCGSAYVYRFNGNTWVEEQKLSASDAAQGDEFGNAVSVSGDVAVVGAWRDSCAAGYSCGSAYVYRFNGSSWVEQAKLTTSDPVAHDDFGHSVSVSGDVVVVTAIGFDCAGGGGCGSAYVYRFNGSTWLEESKLTASDAAAEPFGVAVSVSGDAVAVGAPFDDCAAGLSCGSVYVYRFNSGSWVEQAKLTASDAVEGDIFGYSVSVSGDTVVVGAHQADCAAGLSCGSAYVYRFNGGTWIEQAKLIALDAAQGDGFGWSVSVSRDVAVVGALSDACAAGFDCGSTYVYRFNGSSWIQQGKLTSSDAAQSDRFGNSVSISGDTAVVGAPFDDCAAGLYCGSAYVFGLADLPPPVDCNANGIPDECDIAACTGDPACADCNANSIPDGCEPDCNSNAIPDDCDIADCAGDPACTDCNANSIPDACEVDCNSNAIPDECEITSGTSSDCNGNGVPDECESPLTLCDDGVPCTIDSCDEANQTCLHVPDAAVCDDGLYCNGLEICDTILGCQAGTPPTCNDGVACTVDTCDTVSDACSNIPSDALCDDGMFCNGPEICDTLLGCQTGIPPTCDDGVACTFDACDAVSDACSNIPSDALCDDGLFCNGPETCDPVVGCRPGTPLNCDDSVGCTIDACNEVSDRCTHAPDDSACNDGNVCNGLETCDPPGGCSSGNPLICDDGLFCNGVESCDPQAGCVAGTPPCDETQICYEDKDDCFDNIIPTVSEWGLVILTLLLLTSVKVAFGRKVADRALNNQM